MTFEGYHIRILEVKDLFPYYAMIERNRERLADFFAGTVSKTKNLELTKEFLFEISQKVKEKSYFPYIIVDNNNNEFVGFIDIKNIDWNIPKAELGCYIDENYAGKGIASNALDVFLNYAFTKYNFMKFFLRTHKSNVQAIKVAEKCGFELEGHIRRDYKTTSGELVDLLYFGKLSS